MLALKSPALPYDHWRAISGHPTPLLRRSMSGRALPQRVLGQNQLLSSWLESVKCLLYLSLKTLLEKVAKCLSTHLDSR